MNEFELIYKYFSDWPEVGKQPLLGIGDDAALVSVESGTQLVVAADTLVAGRHFPENAHPALIASRAMRVNLSDMAAMGAEPLHYTLCLTLPSSDDDWLPLFAARLREESQLFNCSLIGGDTTRGELCISLQMLGKVKSGTALKRSNAKPGDQIWVSGNLGDAAAYTALNFSDDASYSNLAERFWYPQPRVNFALAANQEINACIDISDGLLSDLGHICKASGVGANINLADIPQSQELKDRFPEKALQLAISGGDDYELCFTASPNSQTKLEKIAAEQEISLSQVGNVVAGSSGVKCLDNTGAMVTVDSTGYSHF